MGLLLARQCVLGLGLTSIFVSVSPTWSQTFSSGSNGSLGAFAPATNTNVTLPPDGVLNYTTINVPVGVTVGFVPNAANTPVTMLATGDVVIAGTLNVNGVSGLLQDFTASAPNVNPGGRGGPGGFAGGQSGMKGFTNNAASGGYGPGGGPPGVDGTTVQSGTYGAPASFVSLIPLFGGSGGGGTNGGIQNGSPFTGASGGGGGGAILLASTTKITVSGSIVANGGGQAFCAPSSLGNGSGGAIRLVAPQVAVPGMLQAVGPGACNPPGPGRIRIETLVPGSMISITPAPSIVSSLGPITANSVPALINLPTLTISSVAGVQPPSLVFGSYTSADLTLPAGTTNPVPVVITATNTPVPTTFTVRMTPQFANPVSTTANSSGSLATSNATASVTLPNGLISALQAFAAFTLTASIAPMIDGEPVEQVLMAASYGEPSSLTLVMKSGREIPLTELSQDDQVKLSRALEAMHSVQ